MGPCAPARRAARGADHGRPPDLLPGAPARTRSTPRRRRLRARGGLRARAAACQARAHGRGPGAGPRGLPGRGRARGRVRCAGHGVAYRRTKVRTAGKYHRDLSKDRKHSNGSVTPSLRTVATQSSARWTKPRRPRTPRACSRCCRASADATARPGSEIAIPML